MKKIIVILAAAVLMGAPASGQSMLERLKNRAKNAVENNIGDKVEKGVNDILNGNVGKGKDAKEQPEQAKPAESQAAPEAATAPAAVPAAAPAGQVESAYAKSDFVPGDEIFFEDTFEQEQLGEFPSQWDLLSGYAEVGSFAGRKVIAFTDDGQGCVIPLMKEPRAFLPEVFTPE